MSQSLQTVSNPSHQVWGWGGATVGATVAIVAAPTAAALTYIAMSCVGATSKEASGAARKIFLGTAAVLILGGGVAGSVSAAAKSALTKN